jgi:hypothetical protein
VRLAVIALAAAAGFLRCAPSPEHGPPEPTPQPLTSDEREALAVAHEFVRRQCYTNLRCDAGRLLRSGLEHRMPPGVLWEVRHNSLRPFAYGISKGTYGRYGPGWTVFFKPTQDRLQGEEPYLRGLYLSPSLEVLGFEHLDLRIDGPDKIVTFVPDETPGDLEEAGQQDDAPDEGREVTAQ